jgi:hypothetical protein
VGLVYQIESKLNELWNDGWQGPWVATMSPAAKESLDADIASARSLDSVDRREIKTIHTLTTNYGDVTFALNPNMDPAVLVIGSTMRKDIEP